MINVNMVIFGEENGIEGEKIEVVIFFFENFCSFWIIDSNYYFCYLCNFKNFGNK